MAVEEEQTGPVPSAEDVWTRLWKGAFSNWSFALDNSSVSIVSPKWDSIFVVTVQKNFSTNHDFYCRCLTGFTPTGRFSWPTMLTLGVTTVFFKIFFLGSAIFLASDVIVDVYCIVYCLLHLCISRDCQQASRGTRTIHSGLQCKSSSHSKYLWYRIRVVQTIQYKTEIIQLEYI